VFSCLVINLLSSPKERHFWGLWVVGFFGLLCCPFKTSLPARYPFGSNNFHSSFKQESNKDDEQMWKQKRKSSDEVCFVFPRCEGVLSSNRCWESMTVAFDENVQERDCTVILKLIFAWQLLRKRRNWIAVFLLSNKVKVSSTYRN